jgi:hypothetical protein
MGHKAAALRDFNPPYVWSGSHSSFGDVGSMSGLPPIADIARQFLEQVGGRPVG